jgi:hypothetical protein
MKNKYLVLITIVVASLVLASCGTKLSDEEIKVLAYQLLTEQAETQAAQLPPTNTPKPTNTALPPKPAASPTYEFGNKSNPIPLRTTISLTLDNSKNFDISIDEIHRGDEAWQMVLSTNQFNDPPRNGFEYIAIFLTVRYTGGSSDEVLDLNRFDFEVVSEGQILGPFDVPAVVQPDPEFDIELFQGGSASGWFIVEVKTGDLRPLLILGRSSSSPGIFFSLYE